MPTRLNHRMMGRVTATFPTGARTAEIQRDNDGDEDPEQHDELALRDQIGFAGFIDQLGHFAHRFMNRQVLQLHEDRQSKDQAGDAEEQSDHQQSGSAEAEMIHRRKVRQLQAGFAARRFLRAGDGGQQQKAQQSRHGFEFTLQTSFGVCKERGHSGRMRADGLRKRHRILCSHNSSKRKI